MYIHELSLSSFYLKKRNILVSYKTKGEVPISAFSLLEMWSDNKIVLELEYCYC